MARAEYKFKPYKPINLKTKKVGTDKDDVDKTIKSLQKQKENLDKRLQAEGIDPATLGGEFDNRNLLEKALNLNPDQGLLMDFFEVIDRPVQAVKQSLLAAKQGDSVLEGFADGLSGNQEVTGADFIKELTGFESQNAIGQFVTNVGADIVFDPLTYLPPGIIAKSFSALNKLGGRTATRKGVEILEYFVKNADDIVRRADAGEEAAKALVKTFDEMDALKAITATDTAEKATKDLLEKYLKEKGIDAFTDDFVVVSTGTARGKAGRSLKDIEVYYKVKNKGYVRTGVIEVKDLNSTKAWAFKSVIDIDGDVARLSDNYFDLWEKSDVVSEAAKGKLSTFKDELRAGTMTRQRAAELFKDISKADVEALDDIAKTVFFDDLSASGVNFVSVKPQGSTRPILLGIDDAKKYLKVEKAAFAFGNPNTNISEAAAKKLFGKGYNIKNSPKGFTKKIEAFFEIRGTKAARAQGREIEQVIKTSNRGVIISKPDGSIFTPDEARALITQLKDKIITLDKSTVGISNAGLLDDGTIFVTGNTNPFNTKQARSGIGLADGVTTEMLEEVDKAKDFLDNITDPDGAAAIGTRGTGKFTTITEELTFTQRFGEGDFGKPLQTIAKALEKFAVDFKTTFNLTAGFDAKTKALIAKAKGIDMYELEKRSGILAEIKKKLIEIDPKAGELLGELIEADAKIVNGKIIKLRREMGTSDFFDYMYSLVSKGDGGRMAIPAFANQAAETDFLREINRIYRDATGSTDVMFTVKKGATGGQVLAFAGDASEMKDLIKYIQAKIRPIPDSLSFGEKALSREAKAFLRNNIDQVNKYKELTGELLDDLVNVAGFKNMPKELEKQIGYMRHTMSKEAMEGLRKQMPGVLSIYTTPGGRTLGKRNLMGSVQEINAVMRDFFNISEDFFDPNAFNAMEDFITQVARKTDQKQVLDIILNNKGVDGSDLFKVVNNTQEAKALMSPYDTMIKDFREDFKSLYENLAPEAKEAFDAFLAKNGYDAGKAIQLNKSAYNVLKGVEKAYFDVPQLAKIYDKFLNTWKGLTLITPGFHMRNLFGNMFNSYAVGMDVVAQGKYLGKAMQELDQFQKIGKKLAQGLDITDAEKVLMDTVRGYFEQGVSQTHRGIRDLEGVMEASAKGAQKGGLKGTFNNVIRINFNFAEKMDDVQRYALYRWGLDKTGDTVKAANTVAEALFDYSHLTPFEKSYMKRLFPFYTFMKNNFVFQMKNIFKNPAQYAKLGRAYKYASEDLAGYSLEDLPDYATENMWIPLPWTVDKNDKDAIVFLKATLPASDFTELVENPFKKGVTSLTAPIKLLIEFGAGKDLFTGQPLEAFPGQTSAMPEGTGVLSGLRDRRGNFTISQSPLFIKIMNDLGLRAPINIASAGLDIVDTLAGFQGAPENIGDFLQRAGVAGVSEMDRLKLSRLYQDLEKLRELKKFYEQETGNQLPVLPRG